MAVVGVIYEVLLHYVLANLMNTHDAFVNWVIDFSGISESKK